MTKSNETTLANADAAAVSSAPPDARLGPAIAAGVGAGAALLGCLLGELFTAASCAAQDRSMTLLEAALQSLAPATTPAILQAASTPMSLLFFAIAVYEGIVLARKPATG